MRKPRKIDQYPDWKYSDEEEVWCELIGKLERQIREVGLEEFCRSNGVKFDRRTTVESATTDAAIRKLEILHEFAN